MERIRITQQQMNVILMATEAGWRAARRDESLQEALESVTELYEVAPPRLQLDFGGATAL